MEVSSSHQLDVFVLCVLAGILCGIFFDLQRSMRKIVCKGRMITTIQDLLFTLFYTAVALYVGLRFNSGEIRYFQVLGVIFGGLLYSLFLSSIMMKIIAFAGKVLYVGVIGPFIALGKRIWCTFKKIFLMISKASARMKIILKIACNVLKNKCKWLKKRLKLL